MRKILLFLFMVLSVNLAFSQVVRDRIAPLVPQGYSIVGDAFLEELANGDLELRLSDDFTTPAGPDVRILLGNSLSLSGAEEIVNLSDINHFNGPRTFNVPSSISIDEYDFILFYCVQFQQFWASGEFGDVNEFGFTCEDSGVSNANGSNIIEICPSDSSSDIITFENSLNEAPGSNYVYLLTDRDEILEEVIFESNYDFEGTSEDIQRIYGLHYDGDLDINIGSVRTETTADGCFTHSSDSEFILIRKNACITCEVSEVDNANGGNMINICPNDDIDNIIEFENDLNLDAGPNYAYLITDENQILQQIVFEDEYNFEGSSLETELVFGLNFEGNLDVALGQDRRETTADVCFEHSNNNDFITVLKNACSQPIVCLANNTSTMDSIQTINICPNDGNQDSIYFTTSISDLMGSEYAFLVTDTNQILQNVVLDSVFNFEGSSSEEQRVYGINYAGDLNAVLGVHRLETSSSDCFTHSHPDTFLTIQKMACVPEFVCIETNTSTTGSSTEVNICPNDSQADIVFSFTNATCIWHSF